MKNNTHKLTKIQRQVRSVRKTDTNVELFQKRLAKSKRAFLLLKNIDATKTMNFAQIKKLRKGAALYFQTMQPKFKSFSELVADVKVKMEKIMEEVKAQEAQKTMMDEVVVEPELKTKEQEKAL